MSASSNENNDGESKSSDDVCDVNDMLQKMSTVDNEVNDVSICANCGKEGANNICNKCKVTTYCNAVCKKVHKKKHKKDCKEHVRLAAEKHNEEVRIAAELHDKELFKQPPPAEDCPICFVLLPSLDPTGKKYMSCCGKVICSGCVYAPLYDNQGNEVDNKKCPFCRTPNLAATKEELQERYKKRVALNDAIAIFNVGYYYSEGLKGFPQDYNKALELWHRAGELGHAEAYTNIGYAYKMGHGVEVDEKKAIYYYELAAMKGEVEARYNLGIVEEEEDAGMDRAIKHYTIAVRGGSSDSLDTIKRLYAKGIATKEDYTTALRLYQAYLGEIKSAQRDKAAAAHERYCYY